MRSIKPIRRLLGGHKKGQILAKIMRRNFPKTTSKRLLMGPHLVIDTALQIGRIVRSSAGAKAFVMEDDE